MESKKGYHKHKHRFIYAYANTGGPRFCELAAVAKIEASQN